MWYASSAAIKWFIKTVDSVVSLLVRGIQNVRIPRRWIRTVTPKAQISLRLKKRASTARFAVRKWLYVTADSERSQYSSTISLSAKPSPICFSSLVMIALLCVLFFGPYLIRRIFLEIVALFSQLYHIFLFSSITIKNLTIFSVCAIMYYVCKLE